MNRKCTKIMYLADCYEGPQAGTEGQLLQLLKHLDRKRYEPALTLLRSSRYLELNALPCPVRVLGISRIASILSIFKLLWFALGLRRDRYEVVHCYFNDVSIISPPLLKLFGIRVLISRRDMGFWYSPWNIFALRVAGIFVDRYVANCQAVKRVVQLREWASQKKISVIYNGYVAPADGAADADITGELSRLSEFAPIVGIVANLKPIKRIDTLLQAVALIRDKYPTLGLVIVGDDTRLPDGRSVREDLESLARNLRILDCVIFTGKIVNPAPFVNKFTVAVLCSASEGFSNALIEYMHAGRPTICTDTGGNPELLRDGCNGLLFPVGDAHALADRLVMLLSDEALARDLGGSARNTVQAMCSQSRMVVEQMSCYDEVLLKREAGSLSGKV